MLHRTDAVTRRIIVRKGNLNPKKSLHGFEKLLFHCSQNIWGMHKGAVEQLAHWALSIHKCNTVFCAKLEVYNTSISFLWHHVVRFNSIMWVYFMLDKKMGPYTNVVHWFSKTQLKNQTLVTLTGSSKHNRLVVMIKKFKIQRTHIEGRGKEAFCKTDHSRDLTN